VLHVERIVALIQKNYFKYFFEKVAEIAKLVLGNSHENNIGFVPWDER